jgi:glycosyltransferase involved in cell wall biosynthesis
VLIHGLPTATRTSNCATGNSMAEHPFVILISQEVPHSKAAGSILLARLLQGWPADRIRVFGPLPPKDAVKLDCDYVHFRPKLLRLQFTRFAPFAPPLAAVFPRSRLNIVTKRPAIVLSVMQTSMFYGAAYAAAKRLHLPLGLIVHDDPQEIERLCWWGLPLMRRVNGRIYRAADVRFCVSPQLRDLLAERYGASAEILYPNRSVSLEPRPMEWNATLRRHKLTIGYAGTMAYGYGWRLQELAPIFDAAGATLRIYSMQKPDFIPALGVEYAGQFQRPEAVWEHVKAECDAVILPYCRPQHGHEHLYRTHFPSKLPEYLALGMPVIVTGPNYATGVQWAVSNSKACVQVGINEDGEWNRILSRLRADPDLRIRLSQAALEAGRIFEPNKLIANFESRLRAIAR